MKRWIELGQCESWKPQVGDSIEGIYTGTREFAYPILDGALGIRSKNVCCIRDQNGKIWYAEFDEATYLVASSAYVIPGDRIRLTYLGSKPKLTHPDMRRGEEDLAHEFRLELDSLA